MRVCDGYFGAHSIPGLRGSSIVRSMSESEA